MGNPVHDRRMIRSAQRWVVKIGSSLVTDEGRGIDPQAIARWAAQIAALRAEAREVVLVSSGAIAEGMKRLGWTSRPHEIHELQAAAAVGQMGLAQAYESGFSKWHLKTAQILLTHEDIADRTRYLNARTTLTTLLRLGVVPIINENDSVVTDEIKLGDNDTLAALVANLLEADVLVILTDQAGLYTADPREDPTAVLIHSSRASDPAITAMAGGAGSGIGTGGMLTKVSAAKRAASRYWPSATSGTVHWSVPSTPAGTAETAASPRSASFAPRRPCSERTTRSRSGAARVAPGGRRNARETRSPG